METIGVSDQLKVVWNTAEAGNKRTRNMSCRAKEKPVNKGIN